MLAENLKQIRKTKNLSLRALSEKSGISKTTICDLERGILRNPTIETIEKLAKALETDSNTLRGIVSEAKLDDYFKKLEITERYSEVMERLFKVNYTEDEIKKIMDFMDFLLFTKPR